MEFHENQLQKAITISSSGNNTIISAPTTGTIAIDQIDFIPDSAVGLKFISGTTDLSGVYSLAQQQGFVKENAMNSDKGCIFCGNKEAFIINLDAAVQVSGMITYRIIGQ